MSEATGDARRLLAEAERIVVLTGAGISAESGVPTFRGEDGLWKSHRAEDLATPGAFRKDPRLVWEWYAWRRSLVSACRPNEGHRALARIALGRPFTSLVTQNVDGLHEVAARDESQGGDPAAAMPIELHGALFRDRCSGCGTRAPAGASVDASNADRLPRCRGCGALLRPDVVWFGEALDADILQRAFGHARDADVCLVVGTSALVHPAASLPLATLEGGGVIVEVNLEATPLTAHARSFLKGPAAEILPSLLGTNRFAEG
jgi:NAD-dependent deacetylase